MLQIFSRAAWSANWLGLALALALPLYATAQTPSTQGDVASGQTARFDIRGFAVDGNTLLSSDFLADKLVSLTGTNREYGDIMRAIEAIELAYRKLGYAAVQVYAPEQELTGGLVRLQVTETAIGKVTIDGGQKYFNAANLRASLPALKEGTTPNARDLSAQIALVNENPAKQVELLLGIGEQENSVDANLKVREEDPLRIAFTFDNTGTKQTGDNRLGVSLQYANLWNADHVGTVAYQTSPEKPNQVSIYSLSYRMPIYSWAGAVDLILAKSTVNAGTTPTTAGALSFAGSGTVLGLRYTHTLPREGDTSQKLIVGWDIKANDNTCSLGAFGAAGCGAAAVDVTQRPLSLSYSRLMLAPGQATELSGTILANLPGGAHGHDADFQAARPSPSGGTGARANYSLLRGSLTHLRVFAGDWQARFVANAQWTGQALLQQEQLGMAGANAVRGFLEREVSRDVGLQVTAEAYTPNFAETVGTPGNLRALLFLDAASGRNHLLAGESQPKSDLASWGFGFRYANGKALSAKLDVAQVITPNGTQARGDWFGHLSLALSF